MNSPTLLFENLRELTNRFAASPGAISDAGCVIVRATVIRTRTRNGAEFVCYYSGEVDGVPFGNDAVCGLAKVQPLMPPETARDYRDTSEIRR